VFSREEYHLLLSQERERERKLSKLSLTAWMLGMSR
jgi:hypothetical protein